MTNIDVFSRMAAAGVAKPRRGQDVPAGSGSLAFDPELLYVECQACGKPILWESGKTTVLLVAAGVDLGTLDESCMIVSEGCPHCRPEEREGFTLAVVRLAGLTAEEASYMLRPGGSA